MKFLEYLYSQYYNFQVKMGNGDIAPFSSMLIISFTFMLYYFSSFFLIILFIPKDLLDMQYFKYISLFLFTISIIYLYISLVHRRKYKEILRKAETVKKSSSQAILFPLIGFILFNLSWILKMLQNQGKL